ncbi:hypothetical protein GQR58_001605 [Nymphon striatum]|nr:hypothetical protein GQR58_001605 [Nymphon striatum]
MDENKISQLCRDLTVTATISTPSSSPCTNVSIFSSTSAPTSPVRSTSLSSGAYLSALASTSQDSPTRSFSQSNFTRDVNVDSHEMDMEPQSLNAETNRRNRKTNVSGSKSSPSRSLQRKIPGIDRLLEAAAFGATAASISKLEFKSLDKTSLGDSSDSEDLSVDISEGEHEDDTNRLSNNDALDENSNDENDVEEGPLSGENDIDHSSTRNKHSKTQTNPRIPTSWHSRYRGCGYSRLEFPQDDETMLLELLEIEKRNSSNSSNSSNCNKSNRSRTWDTLCEYEPGTSRDKRRPRQRRGNTLLQNMDMPELNNPLCQKRYGERPFNSVNKSLIISNVNDVQSEGASSLVIPELDSLEHIPMEDTSLLSISSDMPPFDDLPEQTNPSSSYTALKLVARLNQLAEETSSRFSPGVFASLLNNPIGSGSCTSSTTSISSIVTPIVSSGSGYKRTINNNGPKTLSSIHSSSNHSSAEQLPQRNVSTPYSNNKEGEHCQNSNLQHVFHEDVERDPSDQGDL